MVESQKDKMRTQATTIASNAISTHMYKKPFEYENNSEYTIGMYSNKFNLLYGKELEDVDFNKNTYQKGEALYIIDQSAHLHQGIKYIVLKNTELFKEIENLKREIISYTIFTFMFVGFIGFVLGRLFLKPIASEREKLDRFIKDTTHELNTPISALIMSISALKDENTRVKERIKLSATRISNIYDDLCYLLKEELNEKGEILKIDFKEIINEQIFLLEAYAKSKKIEIKADLEHTIFLIDEESAKRLINNILTNALKYSKPNSMVELTLKNKTLKVQDQGLGITQKNLKHIKNRYFRANDSEGGFGIGLDIVNSICKRYDLTFTIDSIKDKGTVVTIKL